MTLTMANMHSDVSGKTFNDTGTLSEDITRMDSSQLERYVRIAFTGHRDNQFLPAVFWNQTYEIHHGEPSPGEFFAGIYTNVAYSIAGKTKRADGSKVELNTAYRDTFARILLGIIDECLNYDGQPNKNEFNLAQNAVDAVGKIRFREGESKVGIEENLQEDDMTAVEIEVVIKKLKEVDISRSLLIMKARELARDTRYQNLKYLHMVL